MAEKRIDGGPAFSGGNEESGRPYWSGMTLRDYFAGQALPVWVQAHIDQSVDSLMKVDIARECYLYADAMIAERDREGS